MAVVLHKTQSSSQLTVHSRRTHSHYNTVSPVLCLQGCQSTDFVTCVKQNVTVQSM